MSARERESGELPSPELSLFHRKVGQGLFVLLISRLPNVASIFLTDCYLSHAPISPMQSVAGKNGFFCR
jgi:hypothetical protein